MEVKHQVKRQDNTYADNSVERADIGLRCAPFTLKLLLDMEQRGIALSAIAGEEGVKNQYLRRSLSLLSIENSLIWLIQLGVLRREVDGQGITDSFRLTPLGRLLVDRRRSQGEIPVASFSDRVRNFLAQLNPARFL